MGVGVRLMEGPIDMDSHVEPDFFRIDNSILLVGPYIILFKEVLAMALRFFPFPDRTGVLAFSSLIIGFNGPL